MAQPMSYLIDAERARALRDTVDTPLGVIETCVADGRLTKAAGMVLSTSLAMIRQQTYMSPSSREIAALDEIRETLQGLVPIGEFEPIADRDRRPTPWMRRHTDESLARDYVVAWRDHNDAIDHAPTDHPVAVKARMILEEMADTVALLAGGHWSTDLQAACEAEESFVAASRAVMTLNELLAVEFTP